MRYSKVLAFAILLAALTSIPSSAPAQVSISIGPEPACPYGYYDYAPYNCAPYGYYGPEWFSGGVFIGARPLVPRSARLPRSRRQPLRSAAWLRWSTSGTWREAL
jgi:hypothetical protein